jgi:phosphoglycerate kinase
MIKKIQNLKTKNKTVILRTDYNIPILKGRIDKNSHWRIDSTFDTIKYLIKNNSKIIISCHIGRPEGKIMEELRVAPVARYLSRKLKRKLIISTKRDSKYANLLDSVGETVYYLPKNLLSNNPEDLKGKDILILENIRFNPQEQGKDKNFSKNLASLADIYINDAFAVAHRDETSVSVLPKLLPSGAGFLLQKELKVLGEIKNNKEKPLIFVMGGAKAKTKTELISSFLPKVDEVLVGGVLANTILAAQGIAVGKSIIDKETAQAINGLEITNTKLHLPVDVIASPTKDGKSAINIRPVGNVGGENMILDIGPDTLILFDAIIKKASMIVWNGPMGYTEVKKFGHGTEMILKSILKNKKAKVIIGGGESIALASKHKLFKKIYFISTGGGAMLKFLADKKLPAVDALK